jgi:hypothetical protein
MHGGGLRCLVTKVEQSTAKTSARGEVMETDLIAPMIARCRAQLEELQRAHGRLSGYGAAGRSQMFVNFTRSAALFDRVYDDSPFRQGRYVAGTDIPIVKYEGEEGECCIILAWNYADDIHRRIRDRFRVVATLLPTLRVW